MNEYVDIIFTKILTPLQRLSAHATSGSLSVQISVGQLHGWSDDALWPVMTAEHSQIVPISKQEIWMLRLVFVPTLPYSTAYANTCHSFFPCPPCEPATCSRTCCTAASLQQQMNTSVNQEEMERKQMRRLPPDCCIFCIFRCTLDPSTMIQTQYRARQFNSANDLVTSIHQYSLNEHILVTFFPLISSIKNTHIRQQFANTAHDITSILFCHLFRFLAQNTGFDYTIQQIIIAQLMLPVQLQVTFAAIQVHYQIIFCNRNHKIHSFPQYKASKTMFYKDYWVIRDCNVLILLLIFCLPYILGKDNDPNYGLPLKLII